MRIAIIGCGAVGSLFAAHIAAAGDADVFVYDLDERHVEAMNERGLRLRGAGEVHGMLTATTNARELPACDYGIVATKSIHTASAISATAHAFRDGAVCSVQNGVGNEELIAEHVERVIRGTTFPAGRIVAPGEVEWDAGGDTWIGPFEPSPAPMAQVDELAAVVSASGMPVRALADARGAQWTKLIFNAATNPIGALTGLTHGEACDRSDLRQLISALVQEGVALAAAEGITLDSDPDDLVTHAQKVAHDHRASMLQDVLAQRGTEIDFLNGGIARFGRKAGVPTPLNEALWALVRALESSWSRASG